MILNLKINEVRIRRIPAHMITLGWAFNFQINKRQDHPHSLGLIT